MGKFVVGNEKMVRFWEEGGGGVRKQLFTINFLFYVDYHIIVLLDGQSRSFWWVLV